MKTDKLWLIKYKNNRVQGPLSAEEIIQLINTKTIVGDESIAVYPEGKWKPISVEPVFYDHFMLLLSKGESSNIDPQTTNDSTQDVSYELQDDSGGSTVIADVQEIKSLKSQRTQHQSQLRKQKTKTNKQKKIQTVIYTTQDEESEEEENFLEEIKPSFFFQRKKVLIYTLFIIIIGVLISILDFSNQDDSRDYVVLKVPRKNQSLLKREKVNLLTKKGMVYYFKGSVSNYLKAQDLLVRSIEGDRRNVQGMAFLCLVYLELWPFSKRDSQTLYKIASIDRTTSSLDKGGIRSGLCRGIHLIIQGQYENAKTIVDSSLDGLSMSNGQNLVSQTFLPLFYYMRARSLYYLDNYNTMGSYLDIIKKLLPHWIQPRLFLAEFYFKKNKFNLALSEYNEILKIDPTNKIARIRIGLIEYRVFKKPDKMEKILTTALNSSEKIPYIVLSDAYLGLAEINLNHNTDKALVYAQKAYSYNPSNKLSRNLIVQIGGTDKLKKTRVRGNQLIYEGDQLVRKKQFQAAIGYYEEAFKLNKEKNAFVAIKLAKNLWTIGLFDESIAWLKKAMNADPYGVKPYILMAKYYSERYDFNTATKILQLAQRKLKGNYEIYRGWADLYFKQALYGKTIQYAQLALKRYEADVQSHILLSDAYGYRGDINESLASATRAKEIDPNFVGAQVVYAKALGRASGTDTGIGYFQKLIDNFPLIIEYRMEMVKYLFEDERYQLAKQHVQTVIDIDPQYNGVFLYLGRIFLFEQNYIDSYESFLRAAINRPSDSKPTFYIGLIRLSEKKYNLAKKQFLRVLALNPFYPKIHYYLGKIAFLQKDYDTVLKETALEIKNNPYSIESIFLAGETYENTNRFLDCAIEYQKAIKINPENPSFYVKTARCYRKSGHLDLATKILVKATGNNTSEIQSGDPHLYKELAVIYEMREYFYEAAGAYCNYLNLMPTAIDRDIIKKKMKSLEIKTGKTIKECG